MGDETEEEDLLSDESLDYADAHLLESSEDADEELERQEDDFGDPGVQVDAAYSDSPLAAPSRGRSLVIAIFLIASAGGIAALIVLLQRS